mgnify:CR=1 FL=1
MTDKLELILAINKFYIEQVSGNNVSGAISFDEAKYIAVTRNNLNNISLVDFSLEQLTELKRLLDSAV